MMKNSYFYIDDVIWIFRDLTRERPSSIFENRYMHALKEAHDKYGLKVMLNSFYRTDYFYGDDEFTLADMTDIYKKEWEANSDWIKIAFHAKQEYPDYPHVNISYDDMKNSFLRFKNEIIRFAGEKIMSITFNPHWSPVSKAGCRALVDQGIKVSAATIGERREYNGDPNSLPYGHAGRILQNRQPETMLFARNMGDPDMDNSICGYNHLTVEETEKTRFNMEFVEDKGTGILFKEYCNTFCLNHIELENLENALSEYIGKDYVGVATHEQYAYPEFYAYQPDHLDRILSFAKYMHINGYKFILMDDIL